MRDRTFATLTVAGKNSHRVASYEPINGSILERSRLFVHLRDADQDLLTQIVTVQVIQRLELFGIQILQMLVALERRGVY